MQHHEDDLARGVLVKLVKTRREAESHDIPVDQAIADRSDQMVVLLNCEEIQMPQLRALVSLGLDDLLHSTRPLCWRLLFGTLGLYKPSWRAQMRDSLTTYDGYVQGLFSKQRENSHVVDHPLSRKQDSKWHQKFQDSSLWERIEKDCLRTSWLSSHKLTNPRQYPVSSGVLQQETVMMKMTRVLYVWSKRHPTTGYVQGMNEVLGVISQVYLRDPLDSLESDCYAVLEKVLAVFGPLFSLE